MSFFLLKIEKSETGSSNILDFGKRPPLRAEEEVFDEEGVAFGPDWGADEGEESNSPFPFMLNPLPRPGADPHTEEEAPVGAADKPPTFFSPNTPKSPLLLLTFVFTPLEVLEVSPHNPVRLGISVLFCCLTGCNGTPSLDVT